VDGEKKKTNPAKKKGLEKKKNFFHNGAREDRPMTPTKRALRAAL
jgi:hypothetical protein